MLSISVENSSSLILKKEKKIDFITCFQAFAQSHPDPTAAKKQVDRSLAMWHWGSSAQPQNSQFTIPIWAIDFGSLMIFWWSLDVIATCRKSSKMRPMFVSVLFSIWRCLCPSQGPFLNPHHASQYSKKPPACRSPGALAPWRWPGGPSPNSPPGFIDLFFLPLGSALEVCGKKPGQP